MTETIASLEADFRVFLQQDLVLRCKRNPKYSLRAYARYLQIEPSALSRILRGSRALTPSMFGKLADRCALSPEKREEFRKYHFEIALPPVKRAPQAGDFRYLTEDLFKVISDWYNWALIELMRTDAFDPSPRAVARRLGISVAEVHDAYDRLERIGLIAKDGKSYRVIKSEISTVGIPGSVGALRGMQRQYLERAVDALENVPFEYRDQSTITLACDAEHVPVLKEKLKALRREMAALMEQSKKKRSVYALTISLFPLTQDFRGENA